MMEDVKILLDQVPDEVRETVGQGLKLRLTALKNLHKSTEKAGIDTDHIDDELLLLQGNKERPGLLAIVGAVEGEKKTPDDNQVPMPIEGEKDYRTWALTTDQTQELVTKIAAEEAPAAAVIILNNLEDGEKEKDGGPRASVLNVIRTARSPLARKVNEMKVVNGDG